MVARVPPEAIGTNYRKDVEASRELRKTRQSSQNKTEKK